MAARLTREERLDRSIERTKARVAGSPDSARSLRHSPDSALGTLVREAGYDRVSDKLLEELEDRLLAAGVGTHPEDHRPKRDDQDPHSLLRFQSAGARLSTTALLRR